MTFITRYQNAIFVIVIIAVGFVAYSYFFTGAEEPVLGEEIITSEETTVDQGLISLLLELRAITLDSAIFSDPAFQSLSDFSKELIAEPVGRVNPFAPLDAKP